MMKINEVVDKCHFSGNVASVNPVTKARGGGEVSLGLHWNVSSKLLEALSSLSCKLWVAAPGGEALP